MQGPGVGHHIGDDDGQTQVGAQLTGEHIEPWPFCCPMWSVQQRGAAPFEKLARHVVAQVGREVGIDADRGGVGKERVTGPARDGQRLDETVRLAGGAHPDGGPGQQPFDVDDLFAPASLDDDLPDDPAAP